MNYTERKESLARIAYLAMDIKNTHQILFTDFAEIEDILTRINKLWADSFEKSLSQNTPWSKENEA